MNRELALKYDAAWRVINTVRYYGGLYVRTYNNPYYGEGIVPSSIARIIQKLEKEGRYGK